MKLPRPRVATIEAEMCARLKDVIGELFPDTADPSETMGPRVPIAWDQNGETKTYWAEVTASGSFEDPTSGKTGSIWELWKSKKGGDDVAAAILFYRWLGKDPDKALYPAIFERAPGKQSADVRGLAAVMSVDLENDLSSLIGFKKRFLGLGGSWVLIGPSGVGKSSLAMDLAIHLSSGQEWFGIEVRRPLNVLVVQQENDDGDLSEMLTGALRSLGPDTDRARNVHRRLAFWRPQSRGLNFCHDLRTRIVDCNIDVVLLDPLLAHVSGDVSSQEVVAGFLRMQLQPVLDHTGALAIVVHHTGKPSESRTSTKRDPLELSYSGLGSSEITNWARAIAVLSPVGSDGRTFRFTLAKRRNRSGLRSNYTGHDDVIFLQHASGGIGWTEVAPPEEQKESKTRQKTQESRAHDFSTLASQVIGQAGGQIAKSDLIDSLAENPGISRTVAKKAVAELLAKKALSLGETVPRVRGGHAIQFLKMADSPATTS